MSEENNCPKCEAGAPKWMVTFGDMMSLLLTFFVLLLSFANMDMQKYKDVLGSMEQAFGSQKKIYQLGKEGGEDKPIPMESSESQAEVEKERLVNLLKTMVREEGIDSDNSIFITKDKNGVRMEIAGSVVFAPGQTALLPEAQRFFRKLIPIIKATIYRIVVEGHTDNTPVRSTVFPSNWELSSARAGSVVRFFIERGKLKPKRFSAVGLAETRPIVENDTPVNRARNRRVSIIYEID